MTQEQALAELTRLCEVYERKPDDLRPHQLREWIRALEAMGYERGRAAVTHLIRTWPSTRFPPPGSLGKAAQEVSAEGRPGAMAYYTGPMHDTRDERERLREAIQRQDALVAMDDEEYHDYLLSLKRRKQAVASY